MATDHFVQLFPAVCAGIGLFLIGVVSLLVSGRGRYFRLGSSLLIAGCTLVGAASLDQPGAVAGTARFLALGLVPCILLHSRRLVGLVSGLFAALHRPAIRSSLLALGGIGLVLGSIVKFERADQEAMDASMAEMDWMNRTPMVTSPHTATTDRGTLLKLKEPASPRLHTDWDSIDDRTVRGSGLSGHVIRRGGGTEQSNCHGWVFTGGKYNLSPESVELILKENGYQEIHDPQPGDVVIYRARGEISHTAAVRYAPEGGPVIVEGKWGQLGVFIHPVDKSNYGRDYTYYRSSRDGHLLSGLGGSRPHPNTAE